MKKILVFLALFTLLFIPRINAEGNLYELKLYEKLDSENMTELDGHAAMIVEDMLFENSYEGNNHVISYKGKTLFTLYYEDENDTNPDIEINNQLTQNDNFEYIFNSQEKEDLQKYNSQLKDYDGIDYMLVAPQECTEVCIKRVSLYDKSDNAIIINKATFDGLNVNFDVKVKDVNDFVKYKIIISNPTNEDYEISETKKNSEYITYEYTYEDNEKIVKKNSDKVVYVTIKYTSEVPASAFSGDAFEDVKDLALSLGNGIENPKTADASTIVLFALMLMLIGSIGLYKYTNRKEFIGTMVIALVLIPVSIYALQKIDINIKSKVQIVNHNFSGTIYRHNDCKLPLGKKYTGEYVWYNHGRYFDSRDECSDWQNSYLGVAPQFELQLDNCQSKYVSACEYEMSPEKLPSDINAYIKNEITDGKSTKNQVCFITDKEVCLTEGEHSNNIAILQNESTWFESHNIECSSRGDAYGCTMPQEGDVIYLDPDNGAAAFECDTLSCEFGR